MSLSIENSKPGITVLVNTSQVGSPVKRQPTSTAFPVGYATWGPVDLPTTVEIGDRIRARNRGREHERGEAKGHLKHFVLRRGLGKYRLCCNAARLYTGALGGCV